MNVYFSIFTIVMLLISCGGKAIIKINSEHLQISLPQQTVYHRNGDTLSINLHIANYTDSVLTIPLLANAFQLNRMHPEYIHYDLWFHNIEDSSASRVFSLSSKQDTTITISMRAYNGKIRKGKFELALIYKAGFDDGKTKTMYLVGSQNKITVEAID